MYLTKSIRIVTLLSAALLGVISCTTSNNIQEKPEIKPIAEEAFTYAFPMIMAYDIMYKYSLDKNSSQYKGPFNTIFNESRLFTPKDRVVVTPNSDTPYSFMWMDLRSEPMILAVPEVEKGRYYSVQLISQYTFNFGYIGSRTTGNEAGFYAVVGPNWKGDIPAGINKVFYSETEFALAIYRTQLFNTADMENVKKIQAEYKAMTLSAYSQQPPPAPAPEINWLKIDRKLAKADPFSYLNFILQFTPPIGSAAVEIPLRDSFATIGIQAGKPFPLDTFSADQKIELENGIQKAVQKIRSQVANLGKNENGWRVSTIGFGDRKDLQGDWTLRAAAAMAGIFGNDAAEAMYPLVRVDANGNPLDGSKNNYTLTFSEGQLPPVNAFWSVTMYDGKTQFLIENPIDRYLINSSMLPNLVKNPDGSVTIYIQKDSPGADKESNWLPAPNGPIYMVMRLYWPKEAALNGTWQPPAVEKSLPVGTTVQHGAQSEK